MGRELDPTSIRSELWLLRRNFFVGAFGAHIVTEAANADLRDDQFAAGEFQRDLAFLFRAFGFEDGSVAFDRRDAAAFALVRHWTPRCFVFVNARKFHLKTLFTERPDLEFAPFGFPGAVDLSGRDTLITVGACSSN